MSVGNSACCLGERQTLRCKWEELEGTSVLQRRCNHACHTAAEVVGIVAVADVADIVLGEVVERGVDIGAVEAAGIADTRFDRCSSQRPHHESPWSAVCE